MLISTAKGVLFGAAEQAETASTGEGARFSGFAGLGFALFTYIVCKYDIIRILCSPWKLIVIAASTFGVAMSGFRNMILQLAILGLFAQFLKRRLLLTLLPCAVCYVVLLLLGNGGAFDSVPYGVRRVLTAVPGVDVNDRRAVLEAKASLDWRSQMWE
jgi:hypothetical protein